MPQKAPIWQAVDKLTERLTALEIKLDTPAAPLSTFSVPGLTNGSPAPIPVVAPEAPKEYFPIPPDFVETVDLVLNKSFGVKLEPLKDSPAFIFTIVVPEKYSNLSAAHRQMGLEDLRTKVITFADGVNGVRLWAERVYSNLDKDTQFRIVEDRPLVQRNPF